MSAPVIAAAEGRSRADAIEAYLAQSEVSLERHVRRKILSLAEEHRHRTKVYLDTRFWVMLRDANLGEGNTVAEELLAALLSGVNEGKIICPLSESTFIELFGQSDPRTLRATAELMDRLSLGVCLIEQRMRMGTEVSYLFHGDENSEDLYPLDDLAWVKVAFALGFLHPHNPALPPELMLALQKGTFDEMWDATLITLVDQIGQTASHFRNDLQLVAELLNQGIAQHSATIRSFKQAYRAETAGIASLFGDVISQVFHARGVRAGIIYESAEYEVSDDMLGKALHLTAIALEKDAGREKLRTLHIMASLHASHRWDKHRVLDSHDLLDFNHAAAALAYCDAFFTEKPLHTMIEQKHINLAEAYKTVVASSVADALETVRSLPQSGKSS